MASPMWFLQICWLLSVAGSSESAASSACDGHSGDVSCAADPALLATQEESEESAHRLELLQTQLSRAKAQSGPKAGVGEAVGAHDELQADVASLSLREFLEKNMQFDNQSAMDAFVGEHTPAWQKLQANQTALSLLSTKIGTQRSTCPMKYENQWFTPRINLCTNSFTGLANCKEQGCALLASFFYASSCHFVYYTNAESTSSGYGMCRCMPSSVYSISRYYSSSGNNIYSCSNLV